jgi:hypothetical protein
MTKIELTNSQIIMASSAGVMRMIQFHARNGKPTHGLNREQITWDIWIEGCLTEYALAKHLNLHWEGTGVVGGGDVGKEEVRATDRHTNSLIIRDSDNDNKRYWLLTGRDGSYHVHGYMYARDAKQAKYLTDKGNGREKAYFVPQKDLRNDQR